MREGELNIGFTMKGNNILRSNTGDNMLQTEIIYTLGGCLSCLMGIIHYDLWHYFTIVKCHIGLFSCFHILCTDISWVYKN